MSGRSGARRALPWVAVIAVEYLVFRWFFRADLRVILQLAVGAVLFTTLAVGVVGINRMSTLNDEAARVYDEGAEPLDGLRQLEAGWWQMSAYTARAAIPGLPPASVQSAQQGAAATGEELAANAERVAGMPLSPDARASFEQFATAVQTYLTAHPLSVVWPGLAITITVLGLNLLGDGLREATDPTLARRRSAASTHTPAVVA